MNLAQRTFNGLCGVALFGGIAAINGQPVPVMLGWAAVGFAVTALLDLVLLLITRLL